MANEITLSGNLSYSDANGAKQELGVESLLQSVTTKITYRGQQSIATSETTLELGKVSSVGYVIIINRDDTNYVEVKTGASGTIFAKLPPGGFCILYLGSGVTAPVAIANTAACVIDALVCSQ